MLSGHANTHIVTKQILFSQINQKKEFVRHLLLPQVGDNRSRQHVLTCKFEFIPRRSHTKRICQPRNGARLPFRRLCA